MLRSLKVSAVCMMLVLAMSLCASANSNDSFKNATLTGISHGGDVSGTFDFNSTTHQFSDISVSFSSTVLGSGSVTDLGSINGIYNHSTGNWSFQWQAFASNGDLVTYDVVFNPNTNQFTANGSIQNWWNQGSFNYMQVPEGGTQVAYLMLSGLAMFAGILISRKQRSIARVPQSN
jgi:hypothetical protein